MSNVEVETPSSRPCHLLVNRKKVKGVWTESNDGTGGLFEGKVSQPCSKHTHKTHTYIWGVFFHFFCSVEWGKEHQVPHLVSLGAMLT